MRQLFDKYFHVITGKKLAQQDLHHFILNSN